MKVIKRDGRAVDYDRAKIQIAIEKANKEVNTQDRASKEEIKEIITYIEDLHKKRILVEDIQDIIEEKLMELKKYELAKKYIVYRYTRALVRKQNTTDETILGIIRNSSEDFSNKNNMTASEQRNYIAGEVSRDLTNRLLLPEKIAKAEKEGILYTHNKNFFVHPMINSSMINISDILDNGTVINGISIESPKSFLVACILTTQIIGVIASNQIGEQVIDMIHFGKFLRVSYNKYKKQIEGEYGKTLSVECIETLAREKIKRELEDGIQIMQYQINTLKSIIGRNPKVILLLHLEDDEYVKENSMIIEEILRQRYEGIKDEKGKNATQDFPRLIYVLNELTALDNSKYIDLTNFAIKCSEKRKTPEYLSIIKTKEKVNCQVGNEGFLSIKKNKEGSLKFETTFNQGIVSINLSQIAILSDGDESKFWQLLNERLELCFEALMCRHYSLVGIKSNISPLHWEHGALARIEDEEKIDKFLYDKYSTLGLGLCGIYEMVKIIKGKSILEKEGNQFVIKVIDYLKKTIEKWKNETNIEFVLCETTSKEVLHKFIKTDKEKFGTIKEITDKDLYNNLHDINILDNLKTRCKLQEILYGINYLEFENDAKEEEIQDAIKYLI